MKRHHKWTCILGQIISLLITATGVFTQELVKNYHV